MEIDITTYGPYEIIVIDGASTDETQGELAGKDSDDFRYIRTSTNLFVNGAWNLGVQEAKGEYLCIMNNDILLTANWNKALMDNLVDNILITSPIFTLGDMPFNGRWFRNNPGNCFNINGSCFCMKKADYPVIPDYLKIWFGDNWIYETITRRKGIELAIPDSKIHHFESQTVRSKNPMIEDILKQDRMFWETRGRNHFINLDKDANGITT